MKKPKEKPHEYLNDALELRALLQMESCMEAEVYYGDEMPYCPVCGAGYDTKKKMIDHKDPKIFKKN